MTFNHDSASFQERMKGATNSLRPLSNLETEGISKLYNRPENDLFAFQLNGEIKPASFVNSDLKKGLRYFVIDDITLVMPEDAVDAIQAENELWVAFGMLGGDEVYVLSLNEWRLIKEQEYHSVKQKADVIGVNVIAQRKATRKTEFSWYCLRRLVVALYDPRYRGYASDISAI